MLIAYYNKAQQFTPIIAPLLSTNDLERSRGPTFYKRIKGNDPLELIEDGYCPNEFKFMFRITPDKFVVLLIY